MKRSPFTARSGALLLACAPLLLGACAEADQTSDDVAASPVRSVAARAATTTPTRLTSVGNASERTFMEAYLYRTSRLSLGRLATIAAAIASKNELPTPSAKGDVLEAQEGDARLQLASDGSLSFRRPIEVGVTGVREDDLAVLEERAIDSARDWLRAMHLARASEDAADADPMLLDLDQATVAITLVFDDTAPATAKEEGDTSIGKMLGRTSALRVRFERVLAAGRTRDGGVIGAPVRGAPIDVIVSLGDLRVVDVRGLLFAIDPEPVVDRSPLALDGVRRAYARLLEDQRINPAHVAASDATFVTFSVEAAASDGHPHAGSEHAHPVIPALLAPGYTFTGGLASELSFAEQLPWAPLDQLRPGLARYDVSLHATRAEDLGRGITSSDAEHTSVRWSKRASSGTLEPLGTGALPPFDKLAKGRNDLVAELVSSKTESGAFSLPDGAEIAREVVYRQYPILIDAGSVVATDPVSFEPRDINVTLPFTVKLFASGDNGEFTMTVKDTWDPLGRKPDPNDVAPAIVIDLKSPLKFSRKGVASTNNAGDPKLRPPGAATNLFLDYKLKYFRYQVGYAAALKQGGATKSVYASDLCAYTGADLSFSTDGGTNLPICAGQYSKALGGAGRFARVVPKSVTVKGYAVAGGDGADGVIVGKTIDRLPGKLDVELISGKAPRGIQKDWGQPFSATGGVNGGPSLDAIGRYALDSTKPVDLSAVKEFPAAVGKLVGEYIWRLDAFGGDRPGAVAYVRYNYTAPSSLAEVATACWASAASTTLAPPTLKTRWSDGTMAPKGNPATPATRIATWPSKTCDGIGLYAAQWLEEGQDLPDASWTALTDLAASATPKRSWSFQQRLDWLATIALDASTLTMQTFAQFVPFGKLSAEQTGPIVSLTYKTLHHQVVPTPVLVDDSGSLDSKPPGEIPWYTNKDYGPPAYPKKDVPVLASGLIRLKQAMHHFYPSETDDLFYVRRKAKNAPDPGDAPNPGKEAANIHFKRSGFHTNLGIIPQNIVVPGCANTFPFRVRVWTEGKTMKMGDDSHLGSDLWFTDLAPECAHYHATWDIMSNGAKDGEVFEPNVVAAAGSLNVPSPPKSAISTLTKREWMLFSLDRVNGVQHVVDKTKVEKLGTVSFPVDDGSRVSVAKGGAYCASVEKSDAGDFKLNGWDTPQKLFSCEPTGVYDAVEREVAIASTYKNNGADVHETGWVTQSTTPIFVTQ
jgi:hypothetical protein